MTQGMHNGWGTRFRVELWGGSHTPEIGIRISGVPAGLHFSQEDFERDLSRRRAGAKGTTSRVEADIPELRAGFDSRGYTTGEDIEIIFLNSNTRSGDYDQFRHHPRPSHVDFAARAKYGEEFDLRGSGIFSGRMTVLLVAAGVIAKRLCEGVEFQTSIIEIGGCRDQSRFQQIIDGAREDGDSVGGVVSCTLRGVPVGVGEPYFDSLESVSSHLLFSIPAVKGVEFGSGFEGVRLRGSARNDLFLDGEGHTLSNNEGGVNGGISNGNDITVKVAIKPTASISSPQLTYSSLSGKREELVIRGRHDACITLRAAVVVESVMAIAMAELFALSKR